MIAGTNFVILSGMGTGAWIGILVAVLIVAFVGGFFTARTLIKKELKKNPPINEKMIRAMYQEMGIKPSESKIKQVMKRMERASK